MIQPSPSVSKMDQLPFDSDQQVGALAINEREVFMDNQESSSDESSFATDADPIEIVGQSYIYSMVFLADGEHFVSGGVEGKIRQWRVEDGKEVVLGKLMNAGSVVNNLAVSKDGKWVAAGTESAKVMVWNATNHEKVTEFQAHDGFVRAVDISTDGTQIATGSDDKTVSIWSFPTGQRLLGPFKHDDWLATVKFSPHGKFFATATRNCVSVRVYDSRNGDVFADFPIRVDSLSNRSLAWASKAQLFALSHDGDIHCLEVSTKKTLSKWRIHSNNSPEGITLACNNKVIAASAGSSVSFWNTTTRQQVGTVIQRPNSLWYWSKGTWSMAISPSCDIVISGHTTLTVQNICHVFPTTYCDDSVRQVLLKRKTRRWLIGKDNLVDTFQSLRAQNDRQKDDIANLEKALQELRNRLTTSNEEKEMLVSLRARDASSLQELSSALATSQQRIGLLRADLDAQQVSSADHERTIQGLREQLAASQNAYFADVKKHECETLYAHGRIYDAAQSLLQIENTMTEGMKHDKSIIDWFQYFTDKCVPRLHAIADEALSAEKHDEAFSAYSTLLSLTPSPPKAALTEWARMALIRFSMTEALGDVGKFKVTKFRVYRTICEVLEAGDRVTEAIECFRKMKDELSQETSALNQPSQWEQDFQQHFVEKLEKGGDVARDSKNHDVAIGLYSSALSLNPENISNIVVKLCKARLSLLEDELRDITKVTACDPLNYKGHKSKHAVLHSMGRYEEAFEAFGMMMSSMGNSPDPQIRDMQRCYLDTTPLIRKVVEQTIGDIPRVLIHIPTGRLYDKTMQAAAFEEHPMFNELRSSMTTSNRLDLARIKMEVAKFYEYVMFSHRWQPPEPSFQQLLEHTVVGGLPASPANDKLINFCKIVQSHRFRWAWSDTCCVNQSDKGVQQESVVAMFRWYCHAALTIVHLLGVHSGKSPKKGSLWTSIWNTRGWTYQEYVASKAVQFYTEDWKPYLDLDMFNHKESPIILAEMEQATRFTTQALATLQPGLTRVREKLYLASTRQTTREEDIAYCLFGIFNVTIPIIYGEGRQAVGRLLEHILTRSDNVTILSWTGNTGSNHSYLPSDLTAYDQVVPLHVPQPVETVEMERMVSELRSCLSDYSLINRLYERLHDLPSLSLISGRLRLPGLVFRLTDIFHLPAPESDPGLHIYHATTSLLGDVRIETKDDSLAMQRLVLIHPWISPLIDEDFEDDVPSFDLAVRAMQLAVRLRQPFGAILLASQGRTQYRRIATDSFIKVQIRKETPWTELMDCIRTVNVQ